jgi:hypothetical protein
MRGRDGAIENIVFYVGPSARMLFLFHDRVAGRYYGYGVRRDVIVVARELLEAADINERTGYAVAISFDDDVQAVMTLLEGRYPAADVISAVAAARLALAPSAHTESIIASEGDELSIANSDAHSTDTTAEQTTTFAEAPPISDEMRAVYAAYPGSAEFDWTVPARRMRWLVAEELATWAELRRASERYAAYVRATGEVPLGPKMFFRLADTDMHWQRPWAIPGEAASTADAAPAPMPVSPRGTDLPALAGDAAKVVAWLKRKGIVSFFKKVLLQSGPSSVRRAEAASNVLQFLVQSGRLRLHDDRYEVIGEAGECGELEGRGA